MKRLGEGRPRERGPRKFRAEMARSHWNEKLGTLSWPSLGQGWGEKSHRYGMCLETNM